MPAYPTVVGTDGSSTSRADLLVVGNKGRDTLPGRLLGSVPSDVARRSGVDVLIVRTS